MSHDPWLTQVRMARFGTASAEELLVGDLPVDGLQHAGLALLNAEHSEALDKVARRLIVSLGDRRWTGDAELIAELQHFVDRTASGLIQVRVDLDRVGEALDESSHSESYVDVVEGTVWPGVLFEVDQGPEDFDPASDRWLCVDSFGSRSAYAVMERFIATVDDPDVAMRLSDAITGSGAFRRFRTQLSRYEAEYTRWHRFRDDAQLGRARAWLADEGYESRGA